MEMLGAAVVEKAGVLGWDYNRANFKYDQGLRWQRFTTGRRMAISQAGMFREDVTDLTTVTMSRLKIYAPMLAMGLSYSVTIFVESRSGLKFPGPPAFISCVYLQCLGVGFGFMTLATWLVFHAAIRAQVAATQLRTRLVRLPVPTQQHLDGARRLLATWEENSLYDMLKLPFVMPNSAGRAAAAQGHRGASEAGGGCGGDRRAGARAAEAKGAGLPKSVLGLGMPGATGGTPSWLEEEAAAQEGHSDASSGSPRRDGPGEALEHFELVRRAQREYWGAEAYCRVCFLYGMMHLMHSFAYWLVLHNICELGLLWCANLCAAGITAAVWLMFRLDVLPNYGGCMPIEASGPFVAAAALTMMYAGRYSAAIIGVSQALTILVLVMHIIWTFRLYSVAKPAKSTSPSHWTRESGGRPSSEDASHEVPSWLPGAFQHCTYFVAPPRPKCRPVRGAWDERQPAQGPRAAEGKDPMQEVDMTPWRYTRILLLATIMGWLVLLTGRFAELTLGERMLLTNPGAPPWTRTGQWNGWEHGPVSSKQYAHLTPTRGHFALQKGWRPQGQPEFWSGNMFGFHPEADERWAEHVGPEPGIGAAGSDENTRAQGLPADGASELPVGHPSTRRHDTLGSGGHRRLGGDALRPASVTLVTPAVPLAVHWPAALEPDLLACAPGQGASGAVVALSLGGRGAVVPPDVAAGRTAGSAVALGLRGLLGLGPARGATWGRSGLLLITGSGDVAACPHLGLEGGTLHCAPWVTVPKLPLDLTVAGEPAPAALMEGGPGVPLRAAMVSGGALVLLELRTEGGPAVWHTVHELALPAGDPPVALAASQGDILLLTPDGTAHRWRLHGRELLPGTAIPAPAAGSRRAYRAGCALPDGRVVRLAAAWQRATGSPPRWLSELLL